MFILIGDDVASLRVAASECDLEVLEGPRPFLFTNLRSDGLPDWAFKLQEDFSPYRSDYVLRLKPAAAALCSRTPHEVGVFEHRGRLWAVWDGAKDGFGLTAYIGEHGERLKSYYVSEALKRIAIPLGLSRFFGVGDADSTYLEYSMAQKKIIVRVSPKGDTTVKTEGFEGTACKDATKQLEAALGTVVADAPTQEMYAPPEQTTAIGSGG